MQPDEKIMARFKPGCICKGVKLIRLIEAIEDGATCFENVARKTGIGNGSCGGKRYGVKVAALPGKEVEDELSNDNFPA